MCAISFTCATSDFSIDKPHICSIPFSHGHVHDTMQNLYGKCNVESECKRSSNTILLLQQGPNKHHRYESRRQLGVRQERVVGEDNTKKKKGKEKVHVGVERKDRWRGV